MTLSSVDSGAMRAIYRLFLLVLFVSCQGAGCRHVDEDDFEELTWGAPFDGDMAIISERAQIMLKREFKYVNPDLTKEDEQDYYSTWRYVMSVMYRESTRRRCRIKLKESEDGRILVGVAIISQLNDNVDNPHDKAEARWVKKTREYEDELRLERRIAQRFHKFEVSKTYKEKHRDEPRKGMRQDILDRTRDADLESYEPGKTATDELDEIDEKGKQFDDVKRQEENKKKDDG